MYVIIICNSRKQYAKVITVLKLNYIVVQQLPVIQQNQMANDQEIPDNVTAELEKLEQETGKKDLLVLIKFCVT